MFTKKLGTYKIETSIIFFENLIFNVEKILRSCLLFNYISNVRMLGYLFKILRFIWKSNFLGWKWLKCWSLNDTLWGPMIFEKSKRKLKNLEPLQFLQQTLLLVGYHNWFVFLKFIIIHRLRKVVNISPDVRNNETYSLIL